MQRRGPGKGPSGPAKGLRPIAALKWGGAALLVATLWVGANYQSLQQYFEARSRRNEERRAVLALEREFAELQRQKLQLDIWGFESMKAMRERFGLIKPGESVLIIEEPPPESTPPFDPDRPAPSDPSK